ncbi:threonine synthase [Helicobacter sp. CLO-3]|uniref:threonine synthase n=1 Tax=unclassified Helicobacter TaxID=2593540 RepID=UPI000804D819|nr:MULTISPECIES: threonine synthase [unclassified Helicobacter]OBV29511.1 threonine synthase [Helicobacter sp. CLO-3]OHU85644.1 threonine synthase [Helicobacter sp. CLO-3]
MKTLISTRDSKAPSVDFASAILSPNAANGGLYTLPSLPHIDFEVFLDDSYAALCEDVFGVLGIDIAPDILHAALQSYARFDTPENPAPITKLDNAFFLELYHGPTRAFKDMALCPFGEVFSALAKKREQNYLILTATSGDTGPATLESFANKPNIKVVCLYPRGGTSDVQALQMTTNDAKNINVIGIEGNFDDAQSLLKDLLKNAHFKSALESKGYALSAANSVNFGRIAFQIIYYIWGYLSMVKSKHIIYGEKIYVIVPSGNFGNALGVFFAKMMGLPIEQIIIASNANNILSELILTGIYDIADKKLAKTISPAMDILKSSNVERILFALFGDEETKRLLNLLESEKCYTLRPDEIACLHEHFGAWWGDDKRTRQIIKQAYEKGYILDPHTALGYGAYLELCANHKALICSTAEWSKFAPSVVESIFDEKLSDYDAIEKMLSHGTTIGSHIKELFKKPLVHTKVLPTSDVSDAIIKWL